MKRVTTSKQRKELDGLKVLAAILNFDWERGEAEHLKKLINAISPMYFILIVGDGLKDRGNAKSVQEELKADLLPIVAPEGDIDPEAAYRRIRKLLRKLNEIPTHTVWDIEPIEYEWQPVFKSGAEEPYDYKLFRLPPDEVESKYMPWLTTAELNLLGYRWFIGKEVQSSDSFSHEAYQFVLDAFESGTIERLRTCLHCKAFFVAEDTRQHFCSDEHRNEFNNKQRLRSGYFKERRGGKRKRDLARARKLLREGKSPGAIARATGLSLRVLEREGVIH
jgi:hypothetical protein